MRPATVGSLDERALGALAEMRARTAVLDPSGLVIWGNPAWSRARSVQMGESLSAVAIGVSYLAVCRRSRHPAASAIAEGTRAVLECASSFFEIDCALHGTLRQRTQITVTPPGRGRPGAVMMQVDVHGSVEPLGESAAPLSQETEIQPAEALTPREHQVLLLMARGLGNQAIAHELAVGYATVRAHVRSLMAKLGARSRLEAVVRAVELDLIRLPGPPT